LAASRGEPGLLLPIDDAPRVPQRVRELNLHLHGLARLEAGDGVRAVHQRRRAQDHRVDSVDREARAEVGRDPRAAAPVRHVLDLAQLATGERDELDVHDPPDRIEVLDAQGAGAAQA
jgi:hypothetical protein